MRKARKRAYPTYFIGESLKAALGGGGVEFELSDHFLNGQGGMHKRQEVFEPRSHEHGILQ